MIQRKISLGNEPKWHPRNKNHMHKDIDFVRTTHVRNDNEKLMHEQVLFDFRCPE